MWTLLGNHPFSVYYKQMQISLLVVLFIFIGSCGNPYTRFSDQNSSAAIYEDAVKASNNSDWVTAIQKFELLSPDFLAQRDVRYKYAKALAGRCGYDFIGFAASMADANLGSATFMQYILNPWGNKIILPSFCSLAEAQMRLLWASYTPPEVTEQFFMTFLSLAKMGIILRSKADIGENSGLGDGTTDVGFDACDDADSVSTLTDTEVAEVITGLANFLINFSSVGSSISSSLTSSTDDLAAACGVLTPNPCTQTDVTAVTPGMVTSMRNLLKLSGFGLTTSCVIPPCCP